jgi:single-strand DNA-binding protein
MANLNKVIVMGNLTRDPELRYTPKGTAVGEIGVAINRVWNNEQGQRQEEATFVDITLWGRHAELAQQHLGKGSGVFIEGRLQIDTWEDKATGQKRSKLKVVGENLQFMPDGKQRGERSAPADSAPRREAAPAASPADYDDDGEIPF